MVNEDANHTQPHTQTHTTHTQTHAHKHTHPTNDTPVRAGPPESAAARMAEAEARSGRAVFGCVVDGVVEEEEVA